MTSKDTYTVASKQQKWERKQEHMEIDFNILHKTNNCACLITADIMLPLTKPMEIYR